MKLVSAGGRYIAQCTFDERLVPKAAGFRWDPTVKQWWTTDTQRASKLAAYADDKLRAALEPIAQAHEAAIESSRAADWEGEMPVPEGLSYLPYQKAGIAYAMARPATLLADAMGLGKTIQAIGVINADPSIKRVLIVCPATLKLNWQRELEKWLVRPTTIAIAAGTRPKRLPLEKILIINWDVLAPWRKLIDTAAWDLAIFDEAHYGKSPKAARTKAAFGDAKAKTAGIAATRRMLLTGTPILNRPIEAWPLISYCDPETWPKFWTFVRRYCNATQGKWGWDLAGSSHLDELQEKLRATIMCRRLKEDVLTELPPKRRQVIEISQNGYADLVAAEGDAWTRQEANLERLRADAAEAKRAGDDDAYRDAVARLTEGAGAAFEEVSRARHDLALAKTPSVIAHVLELLEEEKKVVVFAYHHDVIDALCGAIASSVHLDGRDPMDARQRAVDRFQTDPSCRVFVGNIKAAGVGITLTAASTVVFAELDWVPANISQAEDRLHRIGQRESVLVQHLVVDGSLDARMAHTLVAKQAIIDRALDTAPDPLPIVPVGAPATGDEIAMPAVPDGRYCVPATDGTLAFYRVTSPAEGRWAGHTFVEQQLGPNFEAVRIPTMKAGILRQIATDAKGAMLRYGIELGVCGHCGRELTNETSRQEGIGPVCKARWAFSDRED